ncbi:MAG TPA: hypothetical protein PL002_11690, partial [Flavobacteriales bacterium]|nr:hypothetical protein [Flavobacteriales bacterium]
MVPSSKAPDSVTVDTCADAVKPTIREQTAQAILRAIQLTRETELSESPGLPFFALLAPRHFNFKLMQQTYLCDPV